MQKVVMKVNGKMTKKKDKETLYSEMVINFKDFGTKEIL
jgi:hypothetical protein